MKSLKKRWLWWLIGLPLLLLLCWQLIYLVQIMWWINHNPSSTSFFLLG